MLDGCREQVESLERSKASLSSKLAAAQEEAAHAKTELADHSSQAAKLKAQLSSITEAHSKVTLTASTHYMPSYRVVAAVHGQLGFVMSFY